MIVTLKDNGRMVMAIDPFTRKATRNPQQFFIQPDERGYSLQYLARDQWISDPPVIEVDSMSGVSERTGDEPV